MFADSSFVRRIPLLALLATTALVVVAPRSAPAAYERDAYVYSEPAVVYAQRAYNRARPKIADDAYTAFVYASYGRDYAYLGYTTGDQGYFYAAAYMHYVAYSYHEALYAFRPEKLSADARQAAYFAYLFNWFAFAS